MSYVGEVNVFIRKFTFVITDVRSYFCLKLKQFVMGKLLTIEDDVLLRETLTEILEVYGHTVIQAGDGAEGVELFTKTTPDLIICDVNMPKLDGFQVLKKL